MLLYIVFVSVNYTQEVHIKSHITCVFFSHAKIS